MRADLDSENLSRHQQIHEPFTSPIAQEIIPFTYYFTHCFAMFQASVHVTLRPSILDPKGKASEQALHQLGLTMIQDVRIGKLITMNVEASSEEEAKQKVEEACQKLLANDVMEDVEIEMKRVNYDTSQ